MDRLSRLYKADHWDVVVVGGGLVGAVFANLLAGSGRRIAILEGSPPSRPCPPIPLRVSAIAPRSQRALERIGIWELISDEATPYHRMSVWDATPTAAHLHFHDAKMPLGHIVSNDALQVALFKRLQMWDKDESSGIRLIAPGRVASIKGGENNAWRSVTTDTGEELSARLLVGADGAGSVVKNSAGIGTIGMGYGQMGLIATVATDEISPERTAWQRYLPTGPLAVLPLAGNMSSLVWSVPVGDVPRLLAMPVEEFIKRVNRALHHQCSTESHLSLPPSLQSMLPYLRDVPPPPPPHITGLLSDRAAFPLQLQHALAYVQPRLALIGDAAHVIHPQAGQGLNLGIADAIDLADTLLDSRGQDWGDSRLLRDYERKARPRNVAMLAGVHAVSVAFEADVNGPFAVLRNFALDLLNGSPDAKHEIAKVATGNTM